MSIPTVSYENRVYHGVRDGVGQIRTEHYVPELRLTFSRTDDRLDVRPGHLSQLDDSGRLLPPPPSIAQFYRAIGKPPPPPSLTNIRAGATLTAEQAAALQRIVSLREQVKQAEADAAQLFN